MTQLLKRRLPPFTGRCRAASSLAPPGGAYDFLCVGAGAIASGTSEFQMSCTISQRPFSFTQRTMYLPESAAGAPGGRLAAASRIGRVWPGRMAHLRWGGDDDTDLAAASQAAQPVGSKEGQLILLTDRRRRPWLGHP